MMGILYILIYGNSKTYNSYNELHCEIENWINQYILKMCNFGTWNRNL